MNHRQPKPSCVGLAFCFSRGAATFPPKTQISKIHLLVLSFTSYDTSCHHYRRGNDKTIATIMAEQMNEAATQSVARVAVIGAGWWSQGW